MEKNLFKNQKSEEHGGISGQGEPNVKIEQIMEKSKNKMPLIVKGARQIGKTESIKNFGLNNYKSLIEINFVLQPEYKDIFDKGFEIDRVIDVICSGSLMEINYEEIESNSSFSIYPIIYKIPLWVYNDMGGDG